MRLAALPRRMYRVLVPIDADVDRAVAQARAVRALPGSPGDTAVTLLHVFDDDGEGSTTSPAQIASGRPAMAEFEAAGLAVTETSRSGDPAEEIVQAAREVDADLIVLGGRKRSQIGSLIFGSVTQAVLRDTGRPVMVTGDEVPPVEGEEAETEESATG
jgi:nucleotide-binding universal stress UspA family protein